jgi:predicted HTH transcriptional regulator
MPVPAPRPAPVRVPELVENPKGQTTSPSVLYPKNHTAESKRETSPKVASVGMKIARRNDVLNVIKTKGQVSIKDITSLLRDTSVKTAQRELLQLVKEGVLKKEGEKRWSTYRLA